MAEYIERTAKNKDMYIGQYIDNNGVAPPHLGWFRPVLAEDQETELSTLLGIPAKADSLLATNNEFEIVTGL